MKKIAILAIAAALLGFLLGCSLTPAATATDTGSLLLTFSQSGVKAAKDFLPPVDMNIAAYDVYGTGPGGATFQQLGVTSATLAVSSLVTGNWSISVDARNGASQMVATGSVGVAISGGQTASATVTVSPLLGNGTLALSISWPVGIIVSPSITATHAAQGGAPAAFPLALAVDGLSASGTDSSCSAGYHTLSITIKDGAQEVYWLTSVARIIAGSTTTATITLTTSDITRAAGGVNLAVTPDLQNPIDITFTGQQAVLAQGSNMTVTASPSVAVDSYQWYLDGAALTGATGPAVTTGSALSTGPFRLDVVVSKGNVLSAAGVSFRVQQVVAAPGFSPAGGTYTADQQVSLACATAGATIHYTTDSSTPTSASPAYSTPIAVSGVGTTLTIKAIAVKAGMIDSPVASATYSITYTANIANKPSIGDYLVDGRGMTLYWTSSDAPNFSNLPDETLTSWPVFYVSNTQVPAPLNPSDFGTYTRDNGMPQTTYKGYPLYHSILDTAPGNTNGNNLGNWFVVAP